MSCSRSRHSKPDASLLTVGLWRWNPPAITSRSFCSSSGGHECAHQSGSRHCYRGVGAGRSAFWNSGRFDQINSVPASLVGELSPAIHLLEELGLRTETSIINFDMQRARDLACTPHQGLSRCWISSAFGQPLIHPPAPIALKLAPIRIRESNDIRHIIDVRPGFYEFRGAGRGVRRGPGGPPH
jgi:hypothetical protein